VAQPLREVPKELAALGSTSSEKSPRSFAYGRICSIVSQASSTRPSRASASTTQTEHATKALSEPGGEGVLDLDAASWLFVACLYASVLDHNEDRRTLDAEASGEGGASSQSTR
jgi:hypothetical protein